MSVYLCLMELWTSGHGSMGLYYRSKRWAKVSIGYAILLVTMLSDVDYLFIDEIENGIHHSCAMQSLEAPSVMSRELDIQVFATTHSLRNDPRRIRSLSRMMTR